MVTLEQIKLLESKISRAINFVADVTEENSRLKKRNDELEAENGEFKAALEKLKEEKTRVDEGIISALGTLNQFEDAIERSLSVVKASANVKPNPKPVKAEPAAPAQQAPAQAAQPPAQAEPAAPAAAVQTALPQTALPQTSNAAQTAVPAKPAVPSAYTVDEELDDEVLEEIEDSGEAELDIF